MKYASVIAFAGLLTLSAFTAVTSGVWQVKNDSYSIAFDTKSAHGNFKGFKGVINFDENNPAQSGFDVSIDVSTINTGNGMKNKHAKGEGFFDAVKYPLIQFTSSKIEKTANGFLATGKLTIKDVSKDITLPFTFDNSGGEGVFKGGLEINREDYHLERSGVGETVKIDIVLPVKK